MVLWAYAPSQTALYVKDENIMVLYHIRSADQAWSGLQGDDYDYDYDNT